MDAEAEERMIRESVKFGLPTDEELLREALEKIRRKEYGQLTGWEIAVVRYVIETAIAEYTMKRYANANTQEQRQLIRKAIHG